MRQNDTTPSAPEPDAALGWQIDPLIAIFVAAILLMATAFQSESTGGRGTVNGLRVLTVGGIHAALVAYCWFRIFYDTEMSLPVRIIYLLLAPLCVIGIWCIYYDMNGRRSAEVLALDSPFFRLVLTIFALALVIGVLRWTRRVLQRRRHRV